MAHPHNEHRQHKVEKRRVAKIAHRASGGRVHGDAAEDAKMIKSMVKKKALRADGGRVKARADRPHRARGGKVKGKKHGNNVNVIIGGQHAGPAMPPGAGAAMPPMPPGVGAAPPPAMPPKPMMPPPGVAGPGGPPMPMPPRKSGGRIEMPHRTYKTGGRVSGAVSDDASDTKKRGSVNRGSKVYEEGVRNGTQVQHDPGKNDLKDMNRKKVVTFKAGGRVVSFKTGGAVEHPKKGGMAPKLPGGAGGGEARLKKAKMAKSSKGGMAP